MIGTGTVGNVVIHKLMQCSEQVDHLMLAGCRIERCLRTGANVPGKICVSQLDANDSSQTVALIREFNPYLVINIRETTAPGRFYENGAWHRLEALSRSALINFPGVGLQRGYLMYHEQLESLARHLPGVRGMRFGMTLSDRYLAYLSVYRDLGLTRIDAVDYEGHPVVPLKFLRELQPNPGALGQNYKGRTSIACIIRGVHKGHSRHVTTCNQCDHAECYREVGSQAISYTTGVPALAGASLLLSGKSAASGVWNVEQSNPDPFLAETSRLELRTDVLETSPHSQPELK